MSISPTRIPDPADDLAGCLNALTKVYGAEWVFLFIGAVADPHGLASAVRVTLAQRLVDAEKRTTGDPDEARRTVADRLGYTGLRTRTNFYRILRGTTREGDPITAAEAPTGPPARGLGDVPDPREGITDCLFRLADVMGDEWVFILLSRIRDPRGIATTVRAELARTLVAVETAGGTDEVDAIRTVGLRLGYKVLRRGRGDQRNDLKDNSLANFAKLARGLRRSGKPITHPAGTE